MPRTERALTTGPTVAVLALIAAIVLCGTGGWYGTGVLFATHIACFAAGRGWLEG